MCGESLVIEFLFMNWHYNEDSGWMGLKGPTCIKPIDSDDDDYDLPDVPVLAVMRCAHLHPEVDPDQCLSRDPCSPVPSEDGDSHAMCEPCDAVADAACTAQMVCSCDRWRRPGRGVDPWVQGGRGGGTLAGAFS